MCFLKRLQPDFRKPGCPLIDPIRFSESGANRYHPSHKYKLQNT
ncbi:MAG: hypothetical protein RQ735_03255 [Flavobacteriaceae bacterium]|nr:hypothetical protein [Flavobacteriaceae bacterium]